MSGVCKECWRRNSIIPPLRKQWQALRPTFAQRREAGGTHGFRGQLPVTQDDIFVVSQKCRQLLCRVHVDFAWLQTVRIFEKFAGCIFEPGGVLLGVFGKRVSGRSADPTLKRAAVGISLHTFTRGMCPCLTEVRSAAFLP
ncbi:hypothetical protein BaRGS_00029820 [Batillaria attramentaria]|uniref:Uncharacterized protein n=1 Tax=Batillaria attramentaria TaxID=370345 RepID=A0ABD0JVJ9_9CAEN